MDSFKISFCRKYIFQDVFFLITSWINRLLNASSLHTFDNSALYTNLPQGKICEALRSLIIKMFKNSDKHYIVVNTFSNISNKNNFTSWLP
jgi:hypothetical protein